MQAHAHSRWCPSLELPTVNISEISPGFMDVTLTSFSHIVECASNKPTSITAKPTSDEQICFCFFFVGGGRTSMPLGVTTEEPNVFHFGSLGKNWRMVRVGTKKSESNENHA